MIGHVITLDSDTKWIIYDTWGDFDEYYCITDFETQRINELITKNNADIVKIEDYKVEWMFLKRRTKNLAGLEKYL